MNFINVNFILFLLFFGGIKECENTTLKQLFEHTWDPPPPSKCICTEQWDGVVVVVLSLRLSVFRVPQQILFYFNKVLWLHSAFSWIGLKISTQIFHNSRVTLACIYIVQCSNVTYSRTHSFLYLFLFNSKKHVLCFWLHFEIPLVCQCCWCCCFQYLC